MSEEMFGDFSSGWGEGDDEGAGSEGVDDGPGSEGLGDAIDLGGGIVLRISKDVFRTIMHTPEITARVTARCEAITEVANAMAIEKGARYKFTVSDNPENIRARGRVKTANKKAQIDDEKNSTLLKALATVGPTDHGDPHPYWEGTEGAGGADYVSPSSPPSPDLDMQGNEIVNLDEEP